MRTAAAECAENDNVVGASLQEKQQQSKQLGRNKRCPPRGLEDTLRKWVDVKTIIVEMNVLQ